MGRFAVRPVLEEGQTSAYYMRLKSTSARSLGHYMSYSLVSADDVKEPTLWAKAETAQKWADKFTTTSLGYDNRFEVVEVIADPARADWVIPIGDCTHEGAEWPAGPERDMFYCTACGVCFERNDDGTTTSIIV